MARLLVNNTEQVQPQDQNDVNLKLFCRSADDPSERIELTVLGFDPYLHAPVEEVEEQEEYLLMQDSVTRIEYVDQDVFAEPDQNAARVYTAKPQHVPAIAENFSVTWDSDVPFTRRFRIDAEIRAEIEVPDDSVHDGTATLHWREINGVEPGSGGSDPGGDVVETGLQNVDPRVVTFDIEVDDRAEGFPAHGEERILTIVAHDNYTDEVVAFFDADGPTEDVLDESPDEVDRTHVLPDENEMLLRFVGWFNEIDPDLITGWNADDFDIPFLIQRLENLGLGASRLSPLGWAGVTDHGEPRIKGRTVFDLLTVYKKNSFTELRSYGLDDVAQEELGAEKIPFEGSYYELYESDPAKFLEYNARDVTLAAGINEKAGVIEFRDTLRREVGVDFEDSYDNKDFVDMMCRRRLQERGLAAPRRPEYGEEPDSDYEGAFVFDAYEGVAKNVVGIDLASLYPMTMAMVNASPETKVDEEFDGPKALAANDQYFRLDQDGLFKELVDYAIGLKAEYKEKRNSAETPEERAYWSEKYNSAKTITNSLYGVTGWERFFLYDEAVAEAVTLTGQTVIKRTAEYIEATGYDVIYGDTDSTYVKFPDNWDQGECLNTARELCADLNGTVYPELAADHGIPPEDNLWEIEVEAHMERYFQAGGKKMYAYLATWKDGHQIEDPEPSISGFSSKRSDSSQLTMETEREILDEILHGNEERVGDIVFEAAQEIEPVDPDWELIGIPGGMNKKITDNPRAAEDDAYYAVKEDDHGNTFPQDAHPRGVYNANELLEVQIGSDSKPKRVYVKSHWFDELNREIDVIAFTEPHELGDLREELTVDVPRMTDTLLINPLQEICNAVDVDVGAAVRGQEQTGLGAFS